MKQYFFLLIVLILAGTSAAAQEEQPSYHLGDFLKAGGGASRIKIRDLGVSPIYYEGYAPLGTLSIDTETEKHSWSIFGTYGYGTLKAERLLIYQSSIHNINYGGHFHYNIKELRPDINLKVGGAFQGLTNVRFSPSFRNAGSTVESINSIAASAKVEWIIDRTKDRRRLLWLIPMPAGRRVTALSYQLNVPLLTAIWSPAFSYLDDFTEGTVDYERKNELKFGGFRLNNQFDYTYYLKNGNGLRLSYYWEVFKGPDDFGRIEFAQHQALLSFLIRLNALK